jgi:hypothetical protein
MDRYTAAKRRQLASTYVADRNYLATAQEGISDQLNLNVAFMNDVDINHLTKRNLGEKAEAELPYYERLSTAEDMMVLESDVAKAFVANQATLVDLPKGFNPEKLTVGGYVEAQSTFGKQLKLRYDSVYRGLVDTEDGSRLSFDQIVNTNDMKLMMAQGGNKFTNLATNGGISKQLGTRLFGNIDALADVNLEKIPSDIVDSQITLLVHEMVESNARALERKETVGKFTLQKMQDTVRGVISNMLIKGGKTSKEAKAISEGFAFTNEGGQIILATPSGLTPYGAEYLP